MHRPQAIDNLQDTINELLPLAVAKAAQRDAAAQMPVFVGIAAGTPQRTLTRDFDRKRGSLPLQNPAPRLYNFRSLHATPFPVIGNASLPGKVPLYEGVLRAQLFQKVSTAPTDRGIHQLSTQ